MIRLLARLSVGRPVTVVMGFIALLVLGAISWTEIPLEMVPSRFALNQMWVWVPYRDSAPRETERQVVRPIEDHLASAPGLKEMETRASSGSARATLTFHRSVSMDAAYNAVVDRMERAMADMPDEVENYWIYRWNPSDMPIIWGGMSLPKNIEDPYHLATMVIQKRLERAPGVGKVEIWGVYPKRVFIEFNLAKLMSHGIDLGQVMASLGTDNFQMASGRIVGDGHVRYVRSLARFDEIEDLQNFPISKGLTLSDIAEIGRGTELESTIAHINGKSGVSFGIYKESGANTLSVVAEVNAAFAELERDDRAKGLEFVTFFSQGDTIQESLDNLRQTALWGGMFAIIVLYLFLRQWRMTLLIAACIPFTLLLTISMMYFADRSMNLLSLMGLMIAVGMVIDNSIVVVESIYTRRQDGVAPRKAAVKGTVDIGLAITLSTLTTMVVFLPIILMSDDADFSFFMSELGMPVVWALGASLLVALVFTPLTTTVVRGADAIRDPAWVAWLAMRYKRWLGWILNHRTDALVWMVGLTWLTVVVPVESVGCRGDSEGNIGEFTIRYRVSADAGYQDRLDLVDVVDHFVEDNQDTWGVRAWSSRIRGNSQRGRTSVYLNAEREEGQMSREEVIDHAREHLPEVPGSSLGIGWSDNRGPPRNQVTLYLHGEDTVTLERLGNEVQRVLAAVPGVVGVTPELEEEGGQEIRLSIDREAVSKHGLSAQSVGRTVGFALRSQTLSQFKDGDVEVDIRTAFRLEDRRDLDRLLDFPMFSPASSSIVPLRALTDIGFAQGLGSIHRENRITSYPIQIDLEDGLDKGEAWSNLSGAMGGMRLPQGYTWTQDRGWEKPEDDAAQRMALILSITFVFLIMGVLFESFLLPMSIITTVPMAFLGVYWTLFITNTPLDTMAGVGLVILVGVVVNNGIVYIDLVTRLREEGLDRTRALVDAGARRMRPILMTALTTIFGLLPMAVGDASFIGMPYAPLGRVVAGGLATGTVLTLFLLPFLYTVLDDIRYTSRRWFAWMVGQNTPEQPESNT